MAVNPINQDNVTTPLIGKNAMPIPNNRVTKPLRTDIPKKGISRLFLIANHNRKTPLIINQTPIKMVKK